VGKGDAGKGTHGEQQQSQQGVQNDRFAGGGGDPSGYYLGKLKRAPQEGGRLEKWATKGPVEKNTNNSRQMSGTAPRPDKKGSGGIAKQC